MNNASPDTIRHQFSIAMSDMFREEVPAYGTLVDMVEAINHDTLEADNAMKQQMAQTDNIARISQERHGAIRLGTSGELGMMRRMFAIMGMFPVGYYDLSVAGIPVHSTCFRPISAPSLAVNPFRVFTSLLRLDLLDDSVLANQTSEILASRQIFTDNLLALINKAEQNGGLSQTDAESFIAEALETFRWHAKARVDKAMFDKLLNAHRLIADVASFRGPHINHLTPRTLDIDAVQKRMPEQGINPKAVIEGPPPRNCPILLRQTSFKALSEPILFMAQQEEWLAGHHTARFGEVEQRGAALTKKGRALYDELLNAVRAKILPAPDGSNSDDYMKMLHKVFQQFPDNWTDMRAQKLAFFHYYVTDKANNADTAPHTLDALIENGCVAYAPIIYEDFLPVSAAGIFQSNLSDKKAQDFSLNPNQALFEEALGVPILDEFTHYAEIEQQSITHCLTYFKQ